MSQHGQNGQFTGKGKVDFGWTRDLSNAELVDRFRNLSAMPRAQSAIRRELHHRGIDAETGKSVEP